MKEVDPISGNEVPLGATAKEVRDDVDAKLSEGEYVIPADVVRFFGVKHFESLIARAKKGLQEMDQSGRIQGGGEDFPFSVEELMYEDSPDQESEPVKMAEGGYVAPDIPEFDPKILQQFDFSNLKLPEFNMAQLPKVESKEYVGPDGKSVTILFVNGQPVTPPPEGYTEKPSNDVSESSGFLKSALLPREGGEKSDANKKTTWEKDPTEWSNDDIMGLANNVNQHLMVSDVLAGGIKMAGPIGGLIGKAMQASTKSTLQKALEEIDARVAAGTMTTEDAQAARAGLEQGLKDAEKDRTSVKGSIFSAVKDFFTPDQKLPTAADWGLNSSPITGGSGYQTGVSLGGNFIGSTGGQGGGGVNVFSPSESTPRPSAKPDSIADKAAAAGMAKGGLVARRKKC